MHTKHNFSFIKGERIYLRTLLEKDAEGSYPHWLNNSEVCAGTSHYVRPYSKSNALEYIQYATSTDNALILAIVLKEDDLHIGNVALQKINWINRTAEFAILLGDQTKWGKGYGLEASHLLIKHGFHTLNLNRIECATFGNNVRMSKLALALNMKQEGVRKKAAFKNGEFIDIIEFGLLRNEFEDFLSAKK